MRNFTEVELAVINDVKSGALDVINKELDTAIQAGVAAEKWSSDDKRKFLLILDVQEEILRRIRKTFSRHKRRKPKKTN